MADSAALAGGDIARMRRRLVTPEGVDLGLTLATAGQRISAFLLDFLIMIATLIVFTILLSLVAVAVAVPGSGKGGMSFIAVLWLLGFFVLRNGYFILLEMGPRAATFGKRKTGLRVVARSGARLTADAVIARNLMRELEFYLPISFLAYRASEGSADALISLMGLAWTGIFLFFPAFNKDRLRVGDLLAGTWVISAPRRRLALDLIRERAGERFEFTDEQLEAYGIYELQTLEQVLRQDNPQAIATVSATIRGKIGYGWVGDDWGFLTAYYEALRKRLERKLLFGRRRANKHDR
ncbi:MAG TPA: RDD family protein [Allosphingosinicella sp.]|jgi:uncharacterized RDD family membrane protein YckC